MAQTGMHRAWIGASFDVAQLLRLSEKGSVGLFWKMLGRQAHGHKIETIFPMLILSLSTTASKLKNCGFPGIIFEVAQPISFP